MHQHAIALAIVCKAPVAGAAKTRLCPPLTAAEAAELSSCFIADVAATIAAAAQATGSRGVAVYTPAENSDAFNGLLPAGFAMLAQRGDGLGDRLIHAVGELFIGGYGGVCLINADAPTLPAPLLERAVAALRQPGERIVLAPAIDGGYCLIGLKRPHDAVFRNIAWSTSQVLAQTLGRIATLGVPVTLLPPWYDVDDLSTLQLLLHELFGSGVALARESLLGGSASHSRGYLELLLRRQDTAARLQFTGVANDAGARPTGSDPDAEPLSFSAKA